MHFHWEHAFQTLDYLGLSIQWESGAAFWISVWEMLGFHGDSMSMVIPFRNAIDSIPSRGNREKTADTSTGHQKHFWRRLVRGHQKPNKQNKQYL